MERRRAMMRGGKPYDARVEYLENAIRNTTGGVSAFIDTEIIPQGQDNELHISFELVEEGGPNDHLFGAYKADNLLIWGFLNVNKGRLDAYNGTNAFSCSSNNIIDIGIKYDCILKTDGSLDINGRVFERRTNNATNPNGEVTLTLFKTTYGWAPHARIYSFKWIKAGTPLLDLIPVRVGDEGFMYDKVSGRLLGNSGSGKFIIGPDI